MCVCVFIHVSMLKHGPHRTKIQKNEESSAAKQSQHLGTSVARPVPQVLSLFLQGNEHCFDQVIFKDANKCIPFLNCWIWGAAGREKGSQLKLILQGDMKELTEHMNQ